MERFKAVKTIILILFLGIILNMPGLALGQAASGGSAETNAEVKALNKEIQRRKKQVEEIQEKQKMYSRTLRKISSEKASLKNQIAILDNRLAKAEMDIERIKTEIDITNLEIKKQKTEINSKNEEIAREKSHLENIIRLLYKQSNTTALEIILLNDNLSDFLNQVKYLEDMNSEIGDSLDTLYEYKEQLEKKLKILSEKQIKLTDLKKELDDKRTALAAEKENKAFVLEQTKSSEREYQSLLKLAKREQQEAAAEIAGLEKTVRAKIEELSDKKLEFNDSGLIWPAPKNTITAYFHDPDYPFRYIFEHPAIDYRVPQGTPLKAAASGYVARAKNGGRGGYSYIMIVHGDGLSTVYGHVSKIYVKEDEYVVQGQIIGESGGMPGTPGAGRLTTGPHLHFEVRLNGIPVDPLEYLP